MTKRENDKYFKSICKQNKYHDRMKELARFIDMIDIDYAAYDQSMNKTVKELSALMEKMNKEREKGIA